MGSRFPALLLAGLLAALAGAQARAACPEQPPCKGCGCKGGPGYRSPEGRCVGFRELAKVCGDPPETRCVFENAPGTGANHDCALAPGKGRAGSGAPEPLRPAPAAEPPAAAAGRP